MIVIDASAVVDLVLDRPQGDRVAAVMRQHDVTCAPELILVEAASALWRLVRSGHIPAGEAAHLALRRINRMPTRLIGHRQLVVGAWDDRQFLRISDAFYVACARQLDVPLLTTDQRMARALKDRVDVAFIG